MRVACDFLLRETVPEGAEVLRDSENSFFFSHKLGGEDV